MRFQVPQFIEIEDKIVGPLTLKQFVYVAGGIGVCFVIYRFAPIYIGIFLIPIFGGLALMLAFYKYNNKPFIDLLQSGFEYYTKEKLYIWKKREKQVVHVEQKTETPELYVPKLSDSKLKELSWSLDINEHVNPPKDIGGM